MKDEDEIWTLENQIAGLEIYPQNRRARLHGKIKPPFSPGFGSNPSDAGKGDLCRHGLAA